MRPSTVTALRSCTADALSQQAPRMSLRSRRARLRTVIHRWKTRSWNWCKNRTRQPVLHDPMSLPPSLRRLVALCRKETYQILRDPSSNIIAFALPVVLLLIFGFGINLDSKGLRVGIVFEDISPEASLFAASLYGSPYLKISASRSRTEMRQALSEGRVRGYVIIAEDFSEKLKRPTGTAPILIVTDGAEPN